MKTIEFKFWRWRFLIEIESIEEHSEYKRQLAAIEKNMHVRQEFEGLSELIDRASTELKFETPIPDNLISPTPFLKNQELDDE